MSYGVPNNGYPPAAGAPSIRKVPERAELLNSAILAIHRITDEFPRFDVARIAAISPRGGTGMMGSGYPGGGSERMMEGYDEDYGGGGENGDLITNHSVP